MAVEWHVPQEEIERKKKPVDHKRSPTLWVFTANMGRRHPRQHAFQGAAGLHLMDATLKELTCLLQKVYPEARKKGTDFNFAIVFTDLKSPGYQVKVIGSAISCRKRTDDSMTLQSQKFQIGDYLDMAMTPPNPAP